MPLPTERQLLELWERNVAAPPAVRARALLNLAWPDATAQSVAARSVGESERALLLLRRSLLGSRMTAVSDCPACGQRHDVEFDIDALVQHASANASAPVQLQHEDLLLTLRPLSQNDLEEAAAQPDVAQAAALLASRCVQDASRAGERMEAPQLDAAARAAVGAALRTLDPLCELATELECTACGQHWNAGLDAASYLWRELHVWAERLLHQVHRLAVAYGWTEDDVLRLSPWRRATYVAWAER